MAPPLNDFLQKGILRPRRKEVPIEVACLSVEENEDGHWGRLWDEWCVHRVSVTYPRGFQSPMTGGSCRKPLRIS